MRAFAALCAALDAARDSADPDAAQAAALRHYLALAAPADAAWAVQLLAVGAPRRGVSRALVRSAAMAAAGIPGWLFDECHRTVGDLAETVAHLLPPPPVPQQWPLAQGIEQRLLPLRDQPPAAQAAALQQWLGALGADERMLLVRLACGGFRPGVSRLLLQRALAAHAGLEARLVAQRLADLASARTPPSAAGWAALLAPAAEGPAHAGEPYPFCCAAALGPAPDAPVLAGLGPRGHWLAEWQYDSLRAQLVRRGGTAWVWPRQEALATGQLPEVVAQAQALPEGTVLDGELLVWPAQQAAPAPVALLQRRLNRKTLPKSLLAAQPVRFIAHDLLAHAGVDIRHLPQQERRQRLAAVLAGGPIMLSPEVSGQDWADLAAARARGRSLGARGLVLKRRSSPYGGGSGPDRGPWWVWRAAPFTIHAVLVTAQPGDGRRAGAGLECGLAVWNRAPRDAAEAQAVVAAIAHRSASSAAAGALALVAVTRASTGLGEAELQVVQACMRATTVEKFGPVRSLRPTLVVELAFDGVVHSPRHRCGLALRAPRMLRLLEGAALHEAATLAMLQAWLPQAD
ncbi:MAG: ATP-dependent DNA ligase [Burkholderiales bacterium]|nr:ATP-dependent DNA ligase [Burkholderiales bacterium]